MDDINAKLKEVVEKFLYQNVEAFDLLCEMNQDLSTNPVDLTEDVVKLIHLLRSGDLTNLPTILKSFPLFTSNDELFFDDIKESFNSALLALESLPSHLLDIHAQYILLRNKILDIINFNHVEVTINSSLEEGLSHTNSILVDNSFSAHLSMVELIRLSKSFKTQLQVFENYMKACNNLINTANRIVDTKACLE